MLSGFAQQTGDGRRSESESLLLPEGKVWLFEEKYVKNCKPFHRHVKGAQAHSRRSRKGFRKGDGAEREQFLPENIPSVYASTENSRLQEVVIQAVTAHALSKVNPIAAYHYANAAVHEQLPEAARAGHLSSAPTYHKTRKELHQLAKSRYPYLATLGPGAVLSERLGALQRFFRGEAQKVHAEQLGCEATRDSPINRVLSRGYLYDYRIDETSKNGPEGWVVYLDLAGLLLFHKYGKGVAQVDGTGVGTWTVRQKGPQYYVALVDHPVPGHGSKKKKSDF